MSLHCAEGDGCVRNPFYLLHFAGDGTVYFSPEKSKGLAVCKKHIPELAITQNPKELEGLIFEVVEAEGETNQFGAVQIGGEDLMRSSEGFINLNSIKEHAPNAYLMILETLLGKRIF